MAREIRYFDNILPFSAKVGGLVPGGGLISLECDGGEVAVGTQVRPDTTYWELSCI